ncbi:hypothetical protein GCM10010440_41790 [Kitasatospora cinereorecta]
MPIGITVSAPVHANHGKLVRHRHNRMTGTIAGQLVERERDTGRLVSHRVFVRPVGGGIEWEAAPGDLELVDESQPDAPGQAVRRPR